MHPSLARDPSAPHLQALTALPDLGAVRVVLRERLEAAPAVEAARAVEVLLRRGLDGHPGAQRALLGLSLTLIDDELAGRGALRGRIREGAVAEGRAAVAAIVGEGPSRRSLAPKGRLREIAIGEDALLPAIGTAPRERLRHLTRIELLRLHPSPRMIARLLGQRWVRLADVLRIAARRPATGALLAEVARSGWGRHMEVREAVVLNPFAPATLGLPLLPTVRREALVRVRGAGAQDALGVAAGLLLGLRGGRAPSGS